MNNYLVMDAVGYLDLELLDDHLKRKEKYGKKHLKNVGSEMNSDAASRAVGIPDKAKTHHIWQKLGIAAICCAVVLCASVWLFVPVESGTQAEKNHTVNEDTICLQYREVSALSRFELLTLKNKTGDVYSEDNGNTFYTVKNHEGADLLILHSASGEYKLLEFRECYGSEADAEITLQYILNSIYCLNDAEQIEKITFEKADYRKNGVIDKDVPIQKVSIHEAGLNQRILNILSSLKRAENIGIPSVLPYDEEYLTGKTALSSQTERKITINLKDGRTMKLYFIPYGNCVRLNGIVYAGISESDCQWLIEAANINMEYHDWGIPDDIALSEQVVETPRSAN